MLFKQVYALDVAVLMNVVDTENLSDWNVQLAAQLHQFGTGEVGGDRTQICIQVMDALVALVAIAQVIFFKQIFAAKRCKESFSVLFYIGQ